MAAKQRLVDRLHEDLHSMPGMPAHDRAASLNSNARANEAHSTPHPSHPDRTRHHNDPKVLVRWQLFIGRLFGRD